jgi:hypothetical protein
VQLLVGAMGVLLLCVPLFSQGSSGRILGTVTDQSGGVVSGATVTVIDKDRGVARTLATDEAGAYNAPTLIPGTYTVRAEAKGFKTVERQNVVLEVGHEVRIDLTVQPGEQAQTITVTEAIPLVETTNATLGGTLDNTDINDMPLNGRNYQNLLALRPGVMVQPGGSAWSQSTNNIRPDENSWMMDGVINVSFYDDRQVGNAPSAFTDAATIVPIDAIQEFNLEENPKAEYGWKPGAIVNVGIKSGTNTLHGSAYAFGRYDAWDARNAFNPGPQANGTCISPSGVCDKLPVQLKQFGSVVGGPIKKDKLFYLAGYEGLRSTIGNVFVFPMPGTASCAVAPGCVGQAAPAPNPTGSMVDAINGVASSGGGFNTALVSPISLKLLGCTMGATAAATACTGGLILNAPSNTNSYASTFPNLNTSDNGISKIDYTINDKNRISGMLWIGYYEAFGQDHPTVNPLWGSGIFIRSWSNVENWIWTPTSTVVNEVRFGYDRLTQGFSIGDQNIIPDGKGTAVCTTSGCGGSSYPLNTGVKIGGGLPNITIAGFNGGLGNPNGTRPGVTGPSPYFDFQDSLSYLRGNHALKFGGEFTHIEADQISTDFRGVQVNFNGGLAFTGSTPLEDFFAGTPNVGSVLVGNGNRKMVWWHYAGFAQDDWRIKPKLMLNLGLRYEYAQPIKEVNGLYGNFDPNSQYGIVQQGQPGRPTLWKPNRKNFSPRVGFAWDVTGKGTTVVRGGSSVMYTTIFARAFMDNGPPNNSLGNNAEDPSGACNTTVPVGQTCASVGGKTFGGTINLAQATFTPAGGLGWNSGVVFPQGALSCTGASVVGGIVTPGSPCPLYGMDPNLKTPYVVNYNLGVQHSFGSNLSLDVSYVGNGGYDLLAMSDLNQCPPDPTASDCATGKSRPYTRSCPTPIGFGTGSLGCFPYLQIINYQTNHAHSNYNSLQATLTKRTSHGLDFTVGYTYGHGLDNGSLNFQGLPPQDSTHQEREYASSDFDIRHRLTVTAGYAVPGKKGYGQMLEGWKLNTIVTVEGSQPWLVFDGSSAHDFSSGGSGFGDLTDRWDFNGNTNDFRSSAVSIPFCAPADSGVQVGAFSAKLNATNSVSCTQTSGVYGTATTLYTTTNPADTGLWGKCTSHAADASVGGTLFSAGCYVKGNSVMTPPALGTFGTMGRNIFRDSGFKNVDFSVFKEFKFRERFGAEVRWELFNLFNHPNIANPYGSSNTSFLGAQAQNSSSFGCGCATPDVAAGNPLVGSGSSRVMQLGLKLTF